MTRHERARLRLACRQYAHTYLGVKRLPAGVPQLVRDYADGFITYPFRAGSAYVMYLGHPLDGLGRLLWPYRKGPLLA